jgi:hypothetical protein
MPASMIGCFIPSSWVIGVVIDILSGLAFELVLLEAGSMTCDLLEVLAEKHCRV